MTLLRQWAIRMMAQEAPLKKMARSKLSSLLARDRWFNCTEVKVGDSVPSYKSVNRESTPRSHGPPAILDIDGAGATAKFQRQKSRVAKYCARGQDPPGDVGDMKWNPASASLAVLDGLPASTLGKKLANDRPPLGGSEACGDTSAVSPKGSSGTDGGFHSSSPSLVPVPAPPSQSIQVPSFPSLSVQVPVPG